MRYREQRLPSDTRVRLIRGGAESIARLVNVSASGAKVAGASRLETGMPVTLAHLGLRVAARVAWSGAGAAGLRFDRPLAAADLAALRRAGGGGLGWTAGMAAFREMS